MFISFIKVFLGYFDNVVLVIQINFHVRVLSLQLVRQDTRSSCYSKRTHQDKVNIKYQICSDFQKFTCKMGFLAITFFCKKWERFHRKGIRLSELDSWSVSAIGSVSSLAKCSFRQKLCQIRLTPSGKSWIRNCHNLLRKLLILAK